MLTACVEDNFLIVMRVHRGPQHADQSLDQVQPQLYCQICEERCFLPSGLTPVGKLVNIGSGRHLSAFHCDQYVCNVILKIYF